MGEPERIGGDAGYLLLRLLSLQGWIVDVRASFAGDAVIVSAAMGATVVTRVGASVADVACDLVKEATRRRREELASLRMVSDPSGPQREREDAWL